MKIPKSLKILKIKKGFITNSSGSYEWLPISNNAPIMNAPLPLPTNTPISNNIANNGANAANNIPKAGLDPNVIVLTAVLGLVVILLGAANIAKTIHKKSKKAKLDKKNK